MREDNDFFNRINPRSFINLVPEKLRALILEIDEEYWGMSERALIGYAYGKDTTKIPEADLKIRIAIWKEYDLKSKAQHTTPMTAIDFLKGVRQPKIFYKEVERNQARLKILITEPQETWLKYEDILQLSTIEMRKIIELDTAINIKTGLPGYELLKLKFEIFQYLDARQHGAITKKIQTESLNVNIAGTPADLKKFRSIEEIDEEIRKLEGSSRRALMDTARVIEPILQMNPKEAEVLLSESELDS